MLIWIIQPSNFLSKDLRPKFRFDKICITFKFLSHHLMNVVIPFRFLKEDSTIKHVAFVFSFKRKDWLM